MNEAKKRVYFYYRDHNVHAFWMRVHHKALVSTSLVVSFGERNKHALGQEEGMQLQPGARGLCLSTFSALTPSQLGFPHRRNALSVSYPAFSALLAPFLSFPFGKKCWKTVDRYIYMLYV